MSEMQNRQITKENLDQFLAEQAEKNRFLQELLQKMGRNEYRFEIGQYNQLLRALCVHYPTLDDFLMAASAAWIDMNRKKFDGSTTGSVPA